MIKLKNPIKNKNTKFFLALIISVTMAILLLKFPLLSSEGIRKGLEISAGTMIPSLFPFLVISSFAGQSGAIDFLGKKTDKFFRRIFGCSGKTGSVFLFSLFSGFPSGCSLASELYEKNKITQNEAKRIALSSVNAGPAFVVGAVGSMYLESSKAGIIMFLSLSLSSLLIAFFTKLFLPSSQYEEIYAETEKAPLSEAFVSSVYSGSENMLRICGWILLFSCLTNIISGTLHNGTFSFLVKVFSEVSSGCKEMSLTKNPSHLAFVIGWSGLCVHCQLLPYIIRIGLKIKFFLCSRLFHAGLSALITAAFIKIFPCEISVFSSGTEAAVKAFAVSAPAAAGLLLMCIIFILDLDSNKKIC